MKKQFLLVITLLYFFTLASAQSVKLEALLLNLPDVAFKKIETAENFEATYELKIRQLLNHTDSSAGYFYQKVFLTHKGFDQPTVLVTEGYSRSENTIYELTELVSANQIIVEHRFFGESLPDSLNYTYLNLAQATADLHHIRQLFNEIYAKKWVSTGISKGGATTIFYRYYYPNDVDVSVPYVAPINNSFEDKRIYDFLDTIGSDECRAKIKAFQVRLLKNRKKLLPLLKSSSQKTDASYTYLTLEQAFEYAVLEYPFSFWQYGHDCDKIPNEKASIEAIITYFNAVSNITFFSDQLIEFYGPHYYQSATEMGYYGYETQAFEGLLAALSTKTNPHATFLPNKMKAPFNDEILKGVNAWLKTEDNQFIYIYGGIDTWTATAVPAIKKVHSAWFFMGGKHHGNARIKNMTTTEKKRFISTIERYLSLNIDDKLPTKK